MPNADAKQRRQKSIGENVDDEKINWLRAMIQTKFNETNSHFFVRRAKLVDV